jgi:hypothetical protein
VSDFVLDQTAGSAARCALARRAMADETVADPDTVLRALIRLADPAVDEVLFRTQSSRQRGWVLRAVLRDRLDADGRPVLAAGVERFLREQLKRAERRHKGRLTPMPARVEMDLAAAAVAAGEPRLVRDALLAATRMGLLASVARGMRLLHERGLFAEAWTDELREAIAVVIEGTSYGQEDRWQGLIEFGDTGAEAALERVISRFPPLDGLPPVDDADAWTAPNTGSQRYALDWDQVLEYAAVVGTGEEDMQAGYATSRGLDEAAAREDMPEDVRAEFEKSYPRAVFWAARPDVATLARARAAAADMSPAMRHFGTRELLRRGLLHGSLSAADVVAHAAPAADVLALALPTPLGLTQYYTAKGKNGFAPHFVRIPAEAEERYQADLSAAAVEAIGPDPERWLKVLTRVAAWDGSLAELLDAIDAGAPLPTRRGHKWPRGVDPAAVLLEIAPAAVMDALLTALATPDTNTAASLSDTDDSEAQALARILDQPQSERDADVSVTTESRALVGVLTRVLDRGPMAQRLLDHALGPHGTPAMRLAVARNPASTVGALWRLADREPAEPGVLAAVYLHPLASLELRIATVVRAEAAGGLYPGLVRRLVTRYAEPALLQPALESHDPELLHAVLRRSNRSLQTDRRIAAYARLAAAAGPEPVWALELERAGSLEHMHEAVRASMAEHSDEPLRAVAEGTVPAEPARVAEAWDAAFQPARPDTASRVRTRLDGRPDLWLRLAEPGTTLYDLLATLGNPIDQPPAT